MPLGKYPSFSACVADQMKNGNSKEAAGGICGLIEKRHKAKMKKLQELDDFLDFLDEFNDTC